MTNLLKQSGGLKLGGGNPVKKFVPNMAAIDAQIAKEKLCQTCGAELSEFKCDGEVKRVCWPCETAAQENW